MKQRKFTFFIICPVILLLVSILAADGIVDIDGNSYDTVRIGHQVWMSENLNVTKNPDGNPVENFCYNDNHNNCTQDGRLYPWYAAMDSATSPCAQGICPDGWHVPSDQEWKELEMSAGMSRTQADMATTWRGSPAGRALAPGGFTGFDFWPAGRYQTSSNDYCCDAIAYYWTSTEYSTSQAWRRCLDTSSSSVGRYHSFSKSYGFSLRCVKDLDVSDITGQLKKNYSRISTYRADAEITVVTGCTPCGTNVLAQNTGTYSYTQSPESVRVEVNGEAYTDDDYVSTYSDVAEGRYIIRDPIFSLATIDWIAAQDTQAQVTQGDTLGIQFSRSSITYTFKIDRRNWTICEVTEKSSDYSFSAHYYYRLRHDSIPVLTMMAIDNDTTLKNGGYTFSNIELNGEEVSIKRTVSPRDRGTIDARFDHDRLIVSRNALASRITALSVIDVSGRIRMHTRTHTNDRPIVWRHDEHPEPGVYILRIHTAHGVRSVPLLKRN